MHPQPSPLAWLMSLNLPFPCHRLHCSYSGEFSITGPGKAEGEIIFSAFLGAIPRSCLLETRAGEPYVCASCRWRGHLSRAWVSSPWRSCSTPQKVPCTPGALAPTRFLPLAASPRSSGCPCSGTVPTRRPSMHPRYYTRGPCSARVMVRGWLVPSAMGVYWGGIYSREEWGVLPGSWSWVWVTPYF